MRRECDNVFDLMGDYGPEIGSYDVQRMRKSMVVSFTPDEAVTVSKSKTDPYAGTVLCMALKHGVTRPVGESLDIYRFVRHNIQNLEDRTLDEMMNILSDSADLCVDAFWVNLYDLLHAEVKRRQDAEKTA